jgi:hypothetical protein
VVNGTLTLQRIVYLPDARSAEPVAATLATPKKLRARRIVAFGLTERSTPELLYFSSLGPSQNS